MTPSNLPHSDDTVAPVADPADQRSSFSPFYLTTMIIGIVLLIVLIHVGFFNSYIKFFPAFEETKIEGYGTMFFNTVKHFHGMIMMGWTFMLLLQPILIRYKQMKWHRRVGRLSYLVAPLVLVSIFLVNRQAYFENASVLNEAAARAFLALTFPGLFFFAALYILAIRYRHYPPLHMRYMASTAFLLIPPALDRALIFYFNLPGYDVGSIIELTIIGAVTIIDSVKTKRISAFALVFAFEILHKILWHSRETELWQSIGGAIAKLF